MTQSIKISAIKKTKLLIFVSFFCPQSHRTSAKNRPFSTLDPELMLHPEALPRANAVAMTKEYSFLRTSVPRGPKLGSLGIPPPKEKKSRSPRLSKIHSLADYKTPESDAGSGESGVTAADNTMGSLQSTISSVSTLSEVSVVSESSTDLKARPSLQVSDNVSELDGSESGARPGNDGNDSDSSSYSSVSTRGTYGMLSAAVERQRGPYNVEGREIAPEAMGQFPSLQEVLQAASEEQHLLEMEKEKERTAEPRSRRDSFSSRYFSSSNRYEEGIISVMRDLSTYFPFVLFMFLVQCFFGEFSDGA